MTKTEILILAMLNGSDDIKGSPELGKLIESRLRKTYKITDDSSDFEIGIADKRILEDCKELHDELAEQLLKEEYEGKV
ncbi:hypothetical protein [Alkalicoccobacillus gibsonii]|uniref:hypothetical protein n=1 Tax=Alkalicoccobacillus gibsonii TaxID=79881 RepID=UPI003514EDAE